MVSDLPEWLIKYLEDNTGFRRPNTFGHPYYTTTAQSEAVIAFYEFISKPANAAKLECVKPLIDAAKFSASEDMWESNGEYHERWSYQYGEWYQDKLNTALKPFKKEGSDEI